MSEETRPLVCPIRAVVSGDPLSEVCVHEACAWWHVLPDENGEPEPGCAVLAIAHGALDAAVAVDALATVAEAMAAIVPRGGNHAA